MRTETLSESGRLTSPTEADNDAVVLRPAVVLRREDARVRQLDEDGQKKPAG